MFRDVSRRENLYTRRLPNIAAQGSSGVIKQMAITRWLIILSILSPVRAGLAQDVESMRAAFEFAFPIYVVARTRAKALDADGRAQTVNTLSHHTTLADHRSRRVTSPNNDTLYSSAWLDLADGPVMLHMPSLPQRYHSAALMDLFTENFAVLGTRANGGVGGQFFIVGPEWSGTAPASATLIRARTNDVWLLIRVLVNGPDDLDAARAAQARFRLDALGNRGRPIHNAVRKIRDAESFVDVVNEMLARNPASPPRSLRLGRFAAFGIRPGARFRDLPPAQQAVWRDSLPGFLAELRDQGRGAGASRSGWSYPRADLGDFGDNDRFRASVALRGLGALPRKEAMYFRAHEDSAGRTLDGRKRYRIRIPPGGLPVHELGFWSLSLYEIAPDGRRFFVDNPIGRYSFSNRTPGAERNDDGSLDIVIQHERPTSSTNWLPAPSGRFALIMRVYLPKPELIDQRWMLPDTEALE